MLGIRFIKVQPTTYVLQYHKGKLKREGRGLAFFYFAPTTSLVTVPMESVDVPFIFNQVTADFQEISIQGQVTYRVIDAKQLSQLLNFTLDNNDRNYISNDPEKLPQRLINLIQVLMQSELGHLSLRESLRATNSLVQTVLEGLSTSKEITSLGLEMLGLSILSIKPNPETARALEADVREQLLKEADQAIYARRNAAVEQERAIKENELQTEIAVENKKRQVREAQMEAERAVKEKQRQISEEEMTGKISLEKRNKELVALATENIKCEADAKAYSLTVTMQALTGVDAKVLQALASMDMNPSQLIALAFRDIADSAEKIGQLNVSPELLTELLQQQQHKRNK
ncbi:MAG: SPFH domain-containing protein [Candidatus Parabeggiatoa sp. nov. 2]|nr:MAG: membrane protease subunit, stomatin/prohibitin [Beggiatoa sp. 4572_84]RKZ57643.1 MAG: SPFH domain-containing protein [Gammaproteobacteria bacterium]